VILATLPVRHLSLALGFTAASGFAVSADEAETWRLFVADHTAPVVRALETDGTVTASFDIKGPASLTPGPSGTIVYAIQSDADIVQAIDSGIVLSDHGDHADLKVEAPRLLETAMIGDRPVHFVVHDGRIAVFYDDEGLARIYSERGGEPRVVETTAPHHGVAAMIGKYVLVSIPHPEDPSELPIGIRVLDADGAQVGADHACPDLHGEAASGSLMALACATGVLLVRPDGDNPPEVEHLAYASDLPEGKSTTLLGASGLQYFVGNYGADAIVAIDPSAGTFTRVQLPTRRVHFAMDGERPQFVYVFTEDGQLHRINALTGSIADSLTLTGPYSMDGHWRDPRPRLAVAGDEIFVTDPTAGVIHVVDIESFAKEREVEVDGLPYNIVAVGGHGEHH
jgi:zinc transport system substrate-binding protein